MSVPMPLAVCAAMLLSAAVIIVVTATGLQRTPFCPIPSLGIVVLVWLAYPPAQQLPPMVSIIGWLLLTLALYHFPQTPTPQMDTELSTDDDPLEQFFKEAQNR